MTKRGAATGPRLTDKSRNLVATPPEAVEPLLKLLEPRTRYVEPCAGAGDLMAMLAPYGHVCVDAFDVEPRAPGIRQASAVTEVPKALAISNPPYEERLALPIMKAAITWPHPSWWLVPHDWLSNCWCAPFLPHVSKIMPIGRVSWIRDANGDPTGSGFENSSWIELRWMPSGLIVPRTKKVPRRRR